MNVLKRWWMGGATANGESPELPGASESRARSVTTKGKGDAAEELALSHLRAQGLRLLTRQFKTPGRGGGEIDLVMREADGTLVFVEVRARSSGSAGGAAASVSSPKQRRIVLAARHYLLQKHAHAPPPCRFDVVAIEGGQLHWIKAAFQAN